MAPRAHDPVERDLDDDLRNDGPVAPEVLERDPLEVLGHRGDLSIGKAGVGLADGEQAALRVIGLADGKRVVAENAAPLAVAPLDADDDAVERGERLLQL